MKWDQAHKHIVKPEKPGKPDSECKKSPSGEHQWAEGIACGPRGESTRITVCVFCMAIQ